MELSRESRELYAHTGKLDTLCHEFLYGKRMSTRTFGDFVASLEPEERERFRSAQEIVPRLFLGPQTAAFWSWREKFTHYLSMNGNDPTRQIIPRENMKIVASLDDEPSSASHLKSLLKDCVSWIHNALHEDESSRVLVFCTAGRSRSVSVLLAYLMITRKMILLDAMQLVKKKRPWIQPNVGFVNVLMELESELFRTRVITHMPHCELCRMKKKTSWFLETEKYVVILCDQCEQPMAVWRSHVQSISPKDSTELELALRKTANKFFGSSEAYYVDKVQRSIYTHLHWHARKHNRMSRVIEAYRKRQNNTSKM